MSESGYYRFVKNLGKPGKDEALSAAIQNILDEEIYNDHYGVPRMKLALEQKGFRVGTERLTRVMRDNRWIHKPRRRPHGITRATTEVQEKENLIKQDFTSAGPLSALLTDIS